MAATAVVHFATVQPVGYGGRRASHLELQTASPPLPPPPPDMAPWRRAREDQEEEDDDEEETRLNGVAREMQMLAYSQDSLQPRGGRCQDCMTRVPYATLIATIMCVSGVAVFCGTMYRGSALSIAMMDQVFHLRLAWLEPVQLGFVVLGACMGALGLMILFVGCLATGATRHKVYRAWRARVGGRVSCAVFMGVTYVLQLVWLLLLGFLVVVTLTFSMFWALCSYKATEGPETRDCIDFRQFYFLFPEGTRPEDMQVCGTQEMKLFCKDYVERAEVMFILATVACIIVLLSLVHYLMCLAANYAHIRDHEKFQELQELQYLHEPDLGHSKDRF